MLISAALALLLALAAVASAEVKNYNDPASGRLSSGTSWVTCDTSMQLCSAFSYSRAYTSGGSDLTIDYASVSTRGWNSDNAGTGHTYPYWHIIDEQGAACNNCANTGSVYTYACGTYSSSQTSCPYEAFVVAYHYYSGNQIATNPYNTFTSSDGSHSTSYNWFNGE